ADGTVIVWDVKTGKAVRAYRGQLGPVVTTGFNAAASGDGRRLAAVGVDMSGQVWDVVAGKKGFTQPAGIAPDMALALRPDGAVLAGVGLGMVRLWDLRTGELVRTFTGPIHMVHTLAFSADGKRLAAACWDHTVRVWDAEAGKQLHVLRHADRALCVA